MKDEDVASPFSREKMDEMELRSGCVQVQALVVGSWIGLAWIIGGVHGEDYLGGVFGDAWQPFLDEYWSGIWAFWSLGTVGSLLSGLRQRIGSAAFGFGCLGCLGVLLVVLVLLNI